jgi:hypothetical protein
MSVERKERTLSTKKRVILYNNLKQMGLNMGRELELRLAQNGLLGLSLQDMLKVAQKNGNPDTIAQVEHLIERNAKTQSAKRHSFAKSTVAKAPKKTGAKPRATARSRGTAKQTA